MSTDVFISYTHVDNVNPSGDPRGWIDRFEEALQARLNQMLGRVASVWRDEKLGGNDRFDDTIKVELNQTAVFVSVLSPGYLKSKSCRDEVEYYSGAAPGGLQVGTKSRILKVIKTPVGLSEQRAFNGELGISIGYDFFRLSSGGVPLEFDPDLGEEFRRDFLARVNEVAYAVCKTLAVSSGTDESRLEIVPRTGVAIYVAEPSSDLRDDYDRLRGSLDQAGHIVLPEAPSPYTRGYADRVRENVQRARVSIHLIGRQYGVVPEGADESIVALQYAVAVEEAARRPELVVLPWMPPGLEPIDERQADFVRVLCDDPRLVISTLEELKTTVKDRIAPQPPPPPIPFPTPGAAGALSVYLVMDSADAGAAEPLVEWLFTSGFEVLQPLFDGDERTLREDHEQNLEVCDAVLIYYGKTTEFWIRTKLRDLRKAFGYGRKAPFLERAVLLSDPEAPQKTALRTLDATLLPGFGPFRTDMVEPFVDVLRRGRDKTG